MRFGLLLVVALTLNAVDISPEIQPVLTKLDLAMADAERACHKAQAQADEDAIKELEKLLRAERRKKTSTLAPALVARIELLNRDIVRLKDEPLMRATKLETQIARQELNEETWDALAAQPFTVEAGERHNRTKITVAPGELYLVVPHPTDTWGRKDSGKITWRGTADGSMKLVIRCDTTRLDSLFVSEPGLLTLSALSESPRDNHGSIRVKIIRVH